MRATKFVLFQNDPTKAQTCVHYVFDAEGDAIPVHAHTFAHASFAVIGDFEVSDGAGKLVTLTQGNRIQFQAGKFHGLRSLAIGNQLLNINEVGAVADGR